jgi:hypothetical protein
VTRPCHAGRSPLPDDGIRVCVGSCARAHETIASLWCGRCAWAARARGLVLSWALRSLWHLRPQAYHRGCGGGGLSVGAGEAVRVFVEYVHKSQRARWRANVNGNECE